MGTYNGGAGCIPVVKPASGAYTTPVGGKHELQQALLRLFLAGDAVTGPGHSFEALLLQFLVAGNAFAKRAVLNAGERVVHQLQERAIVVRLAEEEFLGVGVRRFVSEIYRRIFVRFAAFLFGASDTAQELFTPRG